MMRASVWTAAVIAAWAIGGCGDNLESPDADAVTTDPVTISLEIGQTIQVTGKLTRKGVALDSADLTWDTSDSRHATVDGNGNDATITAIGSGTAVITATSGERPYTKGTVSATIKVTIEAAKPTSILVSPVNPIVAVGATVPIHVTAHLQDNTFVEVTNDVTWGVAPSAAATATGSQLKGLVAGDATLTAQYMGLYSSTDINVTP